MMEEVGSHDGEDEHVRAAAAGGRIDAVISDALQEAAQTYVPESKYDNIIPCVMPGFHPSAAVAVLLCRSVVPLP